MKTDINEIEVNGVQYVKKGSTPVPCVSTDGLPYVVVRSRDSGCHAGYLKSEEGNTITLVHSRRLWYWSGASTLSQLAEEGVKTPEKCKMPQEVQEITIYGVCEKIKASSECRKTLNNVPIWKQ